MRLSVLSALARMNVDPWEEATRLAAMPKAIAEKTLFSILDLVSDRSWKSPEAAAVAARLVRLLPQPGEAATVAATATANATTATAHRKTLLVGVGGLLGRDVAYDAAPSGGNDERRRRHIGIRRDIPVTRAVPRSVSPGSVRPIQTSMNAHDIVAPMK